MKICKKCNIEKPLTEFRKQKQMKDGLTTWCKSCLIAYHTERRRKQGMKPKSRNKAKNGFKICSKCERLLSIDNFAGNKNNSDGLKCWCYDCSKEYSRSDKGKAVLRKYIKKYRSTEQGKTADERYKDSDKGKLNERKKLMRYLQSDKGKEAIRRRDNKRRAAKKQNGGYYTSEDFNRCMAYFEGKDAYTGEELKDGWTLDHIVPISKGGSSYIYNLVPTNRSINSQKKDKLLGMWYFEQPFFSQNRYDKIMNWNTQELMRLYKIVTYNRQNEHKPLINQHSLSCNSHYKTYFDIILKPLETVIYKGLKQLNVILEYSNSYKNLLKNYKQ